MLLHLCFRILLLHIPKFLKLFFDFLKFVLQRNVFYATYFTSAIYFEYFVDFVNEKNVCSISRYLLLKLDHAYLLVNVSTA